MLRSAVPAYRDRGPREEQAPAPRGTTATRADPPEDPDDARALAARAMAKATVEQMSEDARERRQFEGEKRSLAEIFIDVVRRFFG